jgi:hypothetical protein
VNSLEKALENNYLREHLVGRSSGRETGVNIGGLVPMDWAMLNYNLGLFDTNHEKIAGPGGGSNWSPLLAARVAFSIGDPEMKQYTQGYVINYFGKRKGATVAVNYAHQDGTNETVTNGKYVGGFKSNSVLGMDLLANYGGWNLDAEYDILGRDFSDAFQSANTGLIPDKSYQNTVFHIRTGYDIPLLGGRFVEPVIMFTKFEGDEQAAVYSGGTHQILDAGVNLYLDQNRLKVNLHYMNQDGKAKSLFSGGRDEKGSFVGLGVQMMF